VAGLEDGTFGVPTNVPWGIDFGDGIARHPTQFYEIAFAATLWIVLHRFRISLAEQAGLSFKVMLSSYLLWRLLVDSLKPVPFDYGFGWSGIQLVCAIALLIYVPLGFAQWRKLKVA
jgi:prolipoprotein diacylglyceryltransferase